jgi:CheY-like chemotaxis protein
MAVIKMRKRKIVMIDDDIAACLLVETSLADRFHVISTNNEQRALRLIQGEKPDLILLDIHMMDNLAVILRELEQTDKTQIPVILMTNKAELGETLCLTVTPTGFLTKPLNYQYLAKEINEVMAKSWGADKPVSILVVDDVTLIRTAVSKLLKLAGPRIIMNEAKNGQEAVDISTSINPDIILMDVEMPVMNGIEAAKIIRQKNKEVKIIMLTAHETSNHILDSFAAGADGYVLKNRFAETLQTAIQTVRLGSVWLDPSMAREILTLSIVPERKPVKITELLSFEDVKMLNTVAHCEGDLCLVDPSFVAKLHRLAPVA